MEVSLAAQDTREIAAMWFERALAIGTLALGSRHNGERSFAAESGAREPLAFRANADARRVQFGLHCCRSAIRRLGLTKRCRVRASAQTQLCERESERDK